MNYEKYSLVSLLLFLVYLSIPFDNREMYPLLKAVGVNGGIVLMIELTKFVRRMQREIDKLP